MKQNILILGTLVIVVSGACSVWLYAQEAPRQEPAAPAIHPPSSQPESSTIAQVTSSSMSAPVTLASTTPTVGTPVATPSMITVNTSTPVNVTVQITDPTLIPGGVNLLRVGATGTQPAILGVMQSTGNGTYSLRPVFNETTPGEINLQASAAFRGLLKRLLSKPTTVSVWSTVMDASSGLTFTVPPLGSLPIVNNIGSTSYASVVINIGAVDPTDNTAHSLLRLFALPNPSQEGLQQWFEQNVDDASGTLLTSGAFQQEQLKNGPALVQVAPIPVSYQGGPVAQAYVFLTSKGLVYSISQSQDAQLTDFGYAASSVPGILASILGSVQ